MLKIAEDHVALLAPPNRGFTSGPKHFFGDVIEKNKMKDVTSIKHRLPFCIPSNFPSNFNDVEKEERGRHLNSQSLMYSGGENNTRGKSSLIMLNI